MIMSMNHGFSFTVALPATVFYLFLLVCNLLFNLSCLSVAPTQSRKYISQ